jgi:hypothetical protein
MGSASKNSWASMKGDEVSSMLLSVCEVWSKYVHIPFGTNRMSSHHCMFTPGMYFNGAVSPMSLFCNSSVPARSLPCCFWRCGDASTRYIASMLFAKALKLEIVLFRQLNLHHLVRCLHTRRTSSINVPLPGPTSMICTFSFLPCASHSA